jgi:anaerobic selenocysteine-containing dehydrogenase
MTLGEEIFRKLLEHPEGLIVGKVDPEKAMEKIQNEDGRLNILIPELAEWIQNITADSELRELQGDEAYPLVLSAGLHIDTNANTLMRNPAWNKNRRACTLAIHPEDAHPMNFKDGQTVKVTTEAGAVEIELNVTEQTRPGFVTIPHGFGLEYKGSAYGANANRLTKNTHRDRLAGTPLHRYVPCRIEKV